MAQGLGGTQMPAEFPPASYKGTQYVDSKGCVYIRAGVDGNVTWVPRVTRARQPICGAQPTFAAAKPAPEPAAPAKVAAAPAPKPAQPEKIIVVPAAKPKPTPPAPASVRTVATVTSPSKVAGAPPAARYTVPAPVDAPAQSGVCGPHMAGTGVRCGPQAEYPVTYGSGQARVASAVVVKPGTVAPGTRVAPKHVYQQQKNATEGVSVPEGYRPVWTDDRLNPKRAHQTFEGKARMEQVWTQTVPRRLVDRPITARVAHPQTQQHAIAGQYVQVGMFGVPSNAQRTAGRLQHAGLPVRVANIAKGGRSYQLVMAGPFMSLQELSAALGAVRRAGFRDAFVR